MSGRVLSTKDTMIPAARLMTTFIWPDIPFNPSIANSRIVPA